MVSIYMIRGFAGWLFLFWLVRGIFDDGVADFVAVVAVLFCLLDDDSNQFSLGKFCAAVLWLVFL